MVTIGVKAPAFALPNQAGDIVKLADYFGKPLVIFSFPQAGTPDCTTQACQYRDEYAAFQAIDANIVGISASSVRALAVWHNKHNFPFDLLSDDEHKVLELYGAWGQNVIGILELPFAKRSYWVIDAEGIVRAQAYNVDPVKSIDESLQLLKRLEEK